MPQKTKYITVGIDEAGRGPWAGPVVACALGFNPENPPDNSIIGELNDSKKLTEKQRSTLYCSLVELSLGKKPQVFFGVGVVDNHIIDEINIRQANREAMRRAIVECKRKIKSFRIGKVMIDGRDNYEFDELKTRPTYIVGGDGKIKEISAASIIAKVFRDKLMTQYATLYPEYGFETNAGYGTKKHQQALQNNSDVTGIHRLSYKPVKKMM